MSNKSNTAMREGFEQQRKVGQNVDWFTWQIAWHDALFTQCDIAGEATPSAPSVDDPARDERAAFEAWYVRDLPPELHLPLLKRSDRHPDMYDDDSVEDAWTGWQGRALFCSPE